MTPLWILSLVVGITILAALCVWLASINKDLWNLVNDQEDVIKRGMFD